MATVRVLHGIDDLASDMAAIPPKAIKDMSGAVRRNVKLGNGTARRYAREASGPHGLNYFKRITSEMTGPLEGEYGPTGDVAGNAVGAGWRNGPPNTDLARSLDIVGPTFERDVRGLPGRWFW